MNIDDLLRTILGGGGVVIQNLTINVNTATNQVIGDNAVIDARSVTLPAPTRQHTPLIGNDAGYRYSHCSPSDHDWRNTREPFEPDVWRRREQGDIYNG